MWLSLVVYFIIINYASTKNTTTAPAQAQATHADVARTGEPVNTMMSIGPEADPLENVHMHMAQVGTASYSLTCSYHPNDTDQLPRHWIFKAGEPDVESSNLWHPTDVGCVNLTNSSNMTTAYPFVYTLDPLGRNLNLSDLHMNQSGLYWCVSYNYDYQGAASWDLTVYVMSDYYVESIVLLLINGVCITLIIIGFVYTYWKNRRLHARYKRLRAFNSNTESAAADTAETVPRA